MSVKPVIYKVETYIVPQVNRFPIQVTTNEVDMKTANLPNIKHNNEMCKVRNKEELLSLNNECIKIAKCPIESELIGVKVLKNATNESETILDRSYNDDDDDDDKCYIGKNFYLHDEHIKTRRKEFKILDEAQDTLYPVRQFRRINSLMSIDERSEDSEIKLNDFCHHGYQNGCTAVVPSPEEVSDEVFRENWLRKIEILRQQEIILKEKEINLQNREREVFKKEKELRIAERILKEKLRQAEEQLKQQKDIEAIQKRDYAERTTQILECKSLDEFSNKSSDEYAKEKLKKSQLPINSYEEKDKELNKKANLIRSKSYASSRQSNSSNVNTNINSYNNMQYKERLKISYDDLDSTLSADIGDSSFIRTSERFNPAVYKKPYVFTRSASMRQFKQKSQMALNIEERPKHVIEEDKIIRKLNENICLSQDKNTRFQNYGFVNMPENLQSKMEHNFNNEGSLSSQHNLETNDKISQRKPVGVSKDRPISWNEETDEWLQKKRQAYNLTIQKSIEDKENKCNSIIDNKTSKKNIKNKILTIFR